MNTTIPNSTTATWNQCSIRYHLHSDDPALLQRATEIFQYWSTPHITPTETCHMHARSTPDGWQFQGSQDTQPKTYPDHNIVMRAAEVDAAMAILNRHEEYITAHGALLARDNNAIIILGPSQAGKSTTSCALWADGWQLLADDVAILDPCTTTATPVLRRVSLRHPSAQLLGAPFWEKIRAAKTCDSTSDGYVFHPDEIQGKSRAQTLPLRAILFLQRRNAPHIAPASLRPLISSEALIALCPYTNLIHHLDMGQCLRRLSPLVNAVPAWDISRGPLPQMITALNNFMDSLCQ